MQTAERAKEILETHRLGLNLLNHAMFEICELATAANALGQEQLAERLRLIMIDIKAGSKKLEEAYDCEFSDKIKSALENSKIMVEGVIAGAMMVASSK